MSLIEASCPEPGISTKKPTTSPLTATGACTALPSSSSSGGSSGSTVKPRCGEPGVGLERMSRAPSSPLWLNANFALPAPAQRVDCQELIASVTSSEPVTRRSARSAGQVLPTGWKCSGTTRRWAQLVLVRGEVSSRWFEPVPPSTSCPPRGTTTSQQGRVPVRPDCFTGSPQPSCEASCPDCSWKVNSPVPSACVTA